MEKHTDRCLKTKTATSRDAPTRIPSTTPIITATIKPTAVQTLIAGTGTLFFSTTHSQLPFNDDDDDDDDDEIAYFSVR